jgi:hypothetical protein
LTISQQFYGFTNLSFISHVFWSGQKQRFIDAEIGNVSITRAAGIKTPSRENSLELPEPLPG